MQTIPFDFAYLMYWGVLILLIYNNILFFVWAWMTKTFKDARYRMVAINILLMGGGFCYVMVLNVYARHLKHFDHKFYDDFLASGAWAMRYALVVVLLLVVSWRLTLWAWAAVKASAGGQCKRRKGDL